VRRKNRTISRLVVSSMRLLGSAALAGVSVVEHRPTDTVAQPLVVKDEISNRLWELLALPLALQPAGVFALAFRGSRAGRFDSVGRSTELVCGDMRHHCRLAGSICGVPSGSAQRSCRSHSMATRRTRLRHRDLAAHPRPGLVNGMARPQIIGPHRLEEM